MIVCGLIINHITCFKFVWFFASNMRRFFDSETIIPDLFDQVPDITNHLPYSYTSFTFSKTTVRDLGQDGQESGLSGLSSLSKLLVDIYDLSRYTKRNTKSEKK